MTKLNKFSNTPTDELIRLGQFTDDPFIEELINRLEEEIQQVEEMQEIIDKKDDYISELEKQVYKLEQDLKGLK